MTDETILLAHGSGGRLSHDLVAKRFLPFLANPELEKMDDSAVLDVGGRMAFTTDSYVVNPIFFPGGDIGKLAVCGTVNDLAMSGARPLYLSLSVVIEEGFPISDLERVMRSVKSAAEEAEVRIVAGDTKVVNQGQADKLFITTSGIGIVPSEVNISSSNARPGDKVILSGTIGDHGMAIMSRREGLNFSVPVESDCAPLGKLVSEILSARGGPLNVHCLRDPTRGGLSTTLNEFARQSNAGIIIEEGKVPIKDGIRAACELLGLDPLYVANEGKLVSIVDSEYAEEIVDVMKKSDYGKDATVIGEVISEHPGKVIMKTKLGPSRIIDMLSGELLPRIC